MFYVYVIFSLKFKKRYTGFCSNLETRLKWHNELALKGYTKNYRPWIIIYSEEYVSKNDAMAREKYLKTGVGREFLKNKLPEYY